MKNVAAVIIGVGAVAVAYYFGFYAGFVVGADFKSSLSKEDLDGPADAKVDTQID